MSSRSAFVVAGLATFIVSVTSACAPTASKAADMWPSLYGSTWTLATDTVGGIDPPDVGGSAYSVSIGGQLIVTVVDGERNQRNTDDVLNTLATAEIADSLVECGPPKDAPDQCWVTDATYSVVMAPDSVVRNGDWIEVTADGRKAAFVRSGPAVEPTQATKSPER